MTRAQMRSRLLMAALALSLAATAWVASRDDEASEAPTASTSPRTSKAQAAPPTGWPAALAAAATNADGPAWPAPEPLARQSWGLAAEPSAALATVAAEPAAPKAKAADTEVQAPSAAPPIAYQLLGRMDEAGRPRIVLSNAQRTLVLGVGELIDQQWRIEAIGPSGAQLLWLAGGQKQNLAYSSP